MTLELPSCRHPYGSHSRKSRHPHLHEQMAVCDANYIRLLKLLPILGKTVGKQSLSGLDDACQRRVILVPGSGQNPDMQVQICLTEHFRYTTELEVRQLKPPTLGHYRAPLMTVRLYHDAKTAEVTSYQSHRSLWQLAPGGDSSGWHGITAEKVQLNRFLAEWLSLCIHQGVAPPDAVFGDTESGSEDPAG